LSKTTRILEREVLVAVGSKIAGLGFSAPAKGQTYYRWFEGGRMCAHLSFIKHESDVDVTVDVAVRFEAVEEVVHRWNRLLTKAEKAKTATLGCELGNLARGVPDRVQICNNGQVMPAAKEIVARLDTVGMPYLRTYSRLDAAFELLARDDRDVWLHCPVHSERAKRACACLVAMGRFGEIELFAAKKALFLNSVGDPGAGGFARFLDELRSAFPLA
jgi:hypothetical protein